MKVDHSADQVKTVCKVSKNLDRLEFSSQNNNYRSFVKPNHRNLHTQINLRERWRWKRMRTKPLSWRLSSGYILKYTTIWTHTNPESLDRTRQSEVRVVPKSRLYLQRCKKATHEQRAKYIVMPKFGSELAQRTENRQNRTESSVQFCSVLIIYPSVRFSVLDNGQIFRTGFEPVRTELFLRWKWPQKW